MRRQATALCVALVALTAALHPTAALTSSTLSVYAFPSNPAVNGLVHITATVKAGGSAAGGVSVQLTGPGSITPSSQTTNSYGERHHLTLRNFTRRQQHRMATAQLSVLFWMRACWYLLVCIQVRIMTAHGHAFDACTDTGSDDLGSCILTPRALPEHAAGVGN